MTRTLNSKPITPQEIINNLDKIIPSVVIEAVNNLLKEKYRGEGSISIKHKDIIAEIIRLEPNLTSKEIHDKKWMDFEELFRKAGWNVTYDSPAYCENYDAFFEFKPKKK